MSTLDLNCNDFTDLLVFDMPAWRELEVIQLVIRYIFYLKETQSFVRGGNVALVVFADILQNIENNAPSQSEEDLSVEYRPSRDRDVNGTSC